MVARLETGIVQITHPRYFGLFNPAPTYPAQVADRIVAAFNPQLASSTTSPMPVALEAHVIRAVAARAGLPAGRRRPFHHRRRRGQFYGADLCADRGASGVCAARRAVFRRAAGVLCVAGIASRMDQNRAPGGDRARRGAAGRDRRAGADAHRGAGRGDRRGLAARRRAGDGGGNRRHDGGGHDRPAAGLCRDRRDAPASGSTSMPPGAAPSIASDRHRPLLAGLELANSVTIDAHKWFATTMGCGMFLARRPAVLSAAFRVSTGYMPSNVENVDPYVTSVQWSRRFLGLRLFLSLAAAGWDGYAAHVEQAIDLAALLGERLRARGWTVVNASPLAVLCLEPPAGSADAATIVRRVLASGTAWISVATFEGRKMIRACVTHGATTPDDVEKLVEALEAARPA